ncbi:probable 4-coumarate--CoA ligase 1 [Lingula anatina]|uniref:Luciferin 4-monooxygenase n=1 Tax=Lingula anatina TaxID=7574 RepID=A0A1S3HW20_LINAN|nr:probable 4-coumarate--CoA ligase 1 [Lingula anatina]|eukprot:XP_013390242.1 probable 4-coumarate--CoA ligase 1 [Lingula anatina]
MRIMKMATAVRAVTVPLRVLAPSCGRTPNCSPFCTLNPWTVGPSLSLHHTGGNEKFRLLSTSAVRSAVLQSPHPEIHVPDASFAEHMMRDWEKYSNNVALVDGATGETVSYSMLKDRVIRCASALTRMGFKKGDVLALYAHNVPDYATVFIAVGVLGGTVTALNPLYTIDELSTQLKRSSSSILVVAPSSVKNAIAAKSQCPNVKEVIVFGNVDGIRPFTNLLEDDGHAFPENVDINVDEDVLALPYSSGTTGLPKGVMLTHKNIVANVEQLRHHGVMGYVPLSDCLVGVLPFFHIYGQVVTLFTGLAAGVKIVTMPKFTLDDYLHIVHRHRATSLHVVPPIALRMAKYPDIHKFDLSSVRQVFSAAAPLSDTLSEEFSTVTGLSDIKQCYGLTETSPVTHCCPPRSWKSGSIGVPVPNTKHKIVDIESNTPQGPMQEGELCVQGPQVMKGYANNPEATAECIKDGWFHTGDIGYLDADGHVFISDRLKELIKFKGFQVPPAELEAVILTNPAVLDVAVIGVDDEEAGELPKAFVVVKPHAQLLEIELQDYVKTKVAPYKRLRGGVEFVQEIPKTPTGKILRRMLKNRDQK